MIYSFENLEVWRKSRNLVISIYKITAGFPLDEKYGLSSQLRRAAISVSSNIAEGSTRWSKIDQARFYQIAFGSLMEVLNQSILASDLGFIENQVLTEIRNDIESVGRMLNSLHQSTETPRPF